MPYGGEKADHAKVKELMLKPYLFERKPGKVQIVYAGATWPPAIPVVSGVFQSIAANLQDFQNVEFHFIGTGKIPNDPQSHNIKPIAEKWGIWNKQVFEYPKRIPYLDALIHLRRRQAFSYLGVLNRITHLQKFTREYYRAS